jgi:hypothetical protein
VGQRPAAPHCEAGEGSRRKGKTLTGEAQLATREKRERRGKWAGGGVWAGRGIGPQGGSRPVG